MVALQSMLSIVDIVFRKTKINRSKSGPSTLNWPAQTAEENRCNTAIAAVQQRGTQGFVYEKTETQLSRSKLFPPLQPQPAVTRQN